VSTRDFCVNLLLCCSSNLSSGRMSGKTIRDEPGRLCCELGRLWPKQCLGFQTCPNLKRRHCDAHAFPPTPRFPSSELHAMLLKPSGTYPSTRNVTAPHSSMPCLVCYRYSNGGAQPGRSLLWPDLWTGEEGWSMGQGYGHQVSTHRLVRVHFSQPRTLSSAIDQDVSRGVNFVRRVS